MRRQAKLILWPLPWWTRLWNRITGKKVIFYTMEFGAVRVLDPEATILIECDDDK